MTLIAGVSLNLAGRGRDVYRSICDLTEDHYFKTDAKLKVWLDRCHREAARVPLFISTEALLDRIQDTMNQMGVSHFQVYNPTEDRRLWKGESIDSGIRSRFVEDHLIVYRVLPGSSAAEKGVLPGDDIVKIEGTDQLTPWGAQHRGGHFQLLRQGQKMDVNLESKTLTEDVAPHLRDLGGGVGLLEIGSFRSEFFESAGWKSLTSGLTHYTSLVVDVRENSGGNFVAMLRALSPFFCGEENMGSLLHNRNEGEDQVAFADNTSDEYQIHELDQHHRLGLHTYRNYGCFRGRVTLLVGPDTSSVAEIFSYSFLHRPNSRVWGQPTAGDVVLAVWYDLPELGPGFSVSIPEATYVTPEGKELEGEGVWPQRELYYDLKISLSGRDGWLEEARH